MDNQSKEFLYRYLNNYSPTGFEAEGQKIWMEYIKPYVDDFIIDTYGSVAAVINPGKEYKVVLEAHADEIAWFVSYINSDGFIYVKRNGGSDHIIAPAKRVKIFGDKGIVEGVFGWPAIHTRKSGKEDTPKLNNIFIDVGAGSDKEVHEMGIRPGCVLVFDDSLAELNHKFFVGRALDNRIGGYMIAEVARRISENKADIPYTLYIVNAVQEEVGLRGAQMIAERLKPNVAVVTDVTHDTQTPMIDKIEQGDLACGKGPVLTVGPSVHNVLLKRISDTANQNDIPIQYDAASRSTGTDTDAFAYSNAGVPSALISLPLRYMHTTVEMAHFDDIESIIQLMYNFAVDLEADTKFSYFE